jgi:K(+)-stimulated pyrophosphate-energized sodium pump
MTNAEHLASSAWGAFRRWFYIIAALLAALLLISWLFGRSACKVAAPAAAVAPAVVAPAVAPAVVAAPAAVAAAPAPVAAPAPAPAPTAVAAIPAAILYFGLDKFDLPSDAKAVLGDVVGFLKANPGAKAHISGFHDPSGNQARNEELAHNRARAARSALEAAGITRDQIVMDKPQVTTGTGPAQEARRVEVTVKR